MTLTTTHLDGPNGRQRCLFAVYIYCMTWRSCFIRKLYISTCRLDSFTFKYRLWNAIGSQCRSMSELRFLSCLRGAGFKRSWLSHVYPQEITASLLVKCVLIVIFRLEAERAVFIKKISSVRWRDASFRPRLTAITFKVHRLTFPPVCAHSFFIDTMGVKHHSCFLTLICARPLKLVLQLQWKVVGRFNCQRLLYIYIYVRQPGRSFGSSSTLRCRALWGQTENTHCSMGKSFTCTLKTEINPRTKLNFRINLASISSFPQRGETNEPETFIHPIRQLIHCIFGQNGMIWYIVFVKACAFTLGAALDTNRFFQKAPSVQ